MKATRLSLETDRLSLRVYAKTNGENGRARLLAERLGMILAGELQHNRFFRGRWWNTAIYSILRDEWEDMA